MPRRRVELAGWNTVSATLCFTMIVGSVLYAIEPYFAPILGIAKRIKPRSFTVRQPARGLVQRGPAVLLLQAFIGGPD